MQNQLKRIQVLFGLAIAGVAVSFAMSIVTVVREHHAHEEAKKLPVVLPAMGS